MAVAVSPSQPAVADQLADNRTVFLLDPSLIVLVVSAAAGKNNAVIGELETQDTGGCKAKP